MRIPALLAVTLVMIACSSSPDGGNTGGTGGGDTTGVTTGTSIGTAGGSVTSSDGKVQLTIPAGALSQSLKFSVVPDTATPTDGSALVPASVYDFEPSGTTFAVPVTIRMAYQPSQLPGGVDQSFLSVYHRNGSAWDSIPSSLDTVAHTLTASVSHFSEYGECAGPCTVPFTGRIQLVFKPNCCSVMPVGGQVTVTGGVEWNLREPGGALQMGPLPDGLTGSVGLGAVSPGCPNICSAAATARFQASPTMVAGRYDITVSLVAGGSVISASIIPLLVTALPGFALTASPTSMPLTQGGSATTTLSMTRANFTAPVSLTAASLPAGVTASFAPATLTDATLTSVVTFTASNAVPSGSSKVVIRGTASGAMDQSDTVTLVVAPFAIAVVPPSAIIPVGGSTTFAVKVARSSGFAAPVALAVSGLPTGMSASFASTSVADSSKLTVNVASGVPTGFYALQVTGTAGAVTQVASISLQVAQTGGGYALDFSSCTSQPLWLAYQDGAGPWTTVTGSSGVYSLPAPSSQQVGFAFVTQYGATYTTEVDYVSPLELSQIAALHTQCGVPPFPGFQTFTGVAAGTDSAGGAFGFISMAGGGGGVRSNGPFALYVPSGVNPPYDVTGYLQRTESYLSDSDLVLIHRNVASPGIIDFSTGRKVAVDSITMLGGSLGDLYSVTMYHESESCRPAELYAVAGTSPQFLVTGLPDSLQVAGDLHELEISDQQSAAGRTVTAMFHTLPRAMSVALGTPLTPDVTAVAGPYKRLSLSMPSLPGDYTTISIDGYQTNGSDEYLIATRSYIGGGAVALTMPDFSAMPGFSAAWEPPGSAIMNTKVDGESKPITGSHCGEGVTVKSTHVNGTN